ncbi:MAG: hypothetical protein ABMA64_35405 [Myxococcota bacterium]|jgi:hypothetical protein
MIRIRFEDGAEVDLQGRVQIHPQARVPYHLALPAGQPPGAPFERVLIFVDGEPPEAARKRHGAHNAITLSWPGGVKTLRRAHLGTQANPSLVWIEEEQPTG